MDGDEIVNKVAVMIDDHTRSNAEFGPDAYRGLAIEIVSEVTGRIHFAAEKRVASLESSLRKIGRNDAATQGIRAEVRQALGIKDGR